MRIYSYEDNIKKLTELSKIKTAKNKLVKQESPSTICGINIPYYTIGSGENDIFLIAGVHAREIIGIDFLIKAVEKMVLGIDEFKDIDFSKYKFHILPIINPEGNIIISSAIRTVLKEDAGSSETERICKEFFLKSDVDVKKHDYSNVLLHHAMFEKADYTCIPEKYKKIREKIKYIYDIYKHPKGSLIDWRGNASGGETNKNSPFNPNFINYKNDVEIISDYGIKDNTPGPMGTPSYDKNRFIPMIENVFLFELLEKLYKEKRYCGLISYHSYGAGIEFEPSWKFDETLLNDKKRHMITSVNKALAENYQKYTNYEFLESDERGFDELLRALYPGQLLIELSSKGYNPLGPYAFKNNYESTINDNMKALASSIRLFANLKPILYNDIEVESTLVYQSKMH